MDTFTFDPSYEHNPCILYISLYSLYEYVQDKYSEARKNGTEDEWLREEFSGLDEDRWRLSLQDALRAIILSGIGSGLVIGLEALFRFALNHPDSEGGAGKSDLREESEDVT